MKRKIVGMIIMIVFMAISQSIAAKSYDKSFKIASCQMDVDELKRTDEEKVCLKLEGDPFSR